MSKNKSINLLYIIMIVLFLGFLSVPLIILIMNSFGSLNNVTMSFYQSVFMSSGFLKAMSNSFVVSICSSLITTVLAFVLAYTVNYTNVPVAVKKLIKVFAVLPMLLPTITYGFAIIYTFGKQGLFTKLAGFQFFDIYGFNGLMLGYVIYTLPVAFTLISNTMNYIDKKFMIVSRIMGDSNIYSFIMTVLRPLMGAFATAFIQSFFLSFTDFGIPASVGGQYEVVATVLYNQMLGAAPDFNKGAVVSVAMLIPSIISIFVLKYIDKYNIRYNSAATLEIRKNKVRDGICSFLSVMICLCILSIFFVIFLVPFVQEWPYDIKFTLNNIINVMSDSALSGVYINSIITSVLTAAVGTICAYVAAIITVRSDLGGKFKVFIESNIMITNAIPGMVLGIAYLLMFSGTSLQNTLILILLCNVIHFFSTPYLMMKGALEKINDTWETTAMLMGDSWSKTIVRIITPNVGSSLFEVFGYYFVNSMVTISALIFIVGAKTAVLTTKIKELQHYAKFKDIFVLSIFILITNLMARLIFNKLAEKYKGEK